MMISRRTAPSAQELLAPSSRPAHYFSTVVSLVVLLLAAGSVVAQQPPYPTPRLDSVVPPGNRAGATVEATVTGDDLDDLTGLVFSNPGIKAELLPPPKEEKPEKGKQPPPPPPQRFKITVAADVPLGLYDVRAVGKWGVSNPRAFAVGDLAEVMEKEPNSDVPEAQHLDLNSTVSGTIANNVDVDYFVFTGKKGQRVLIRCAASSLDSRLHALVQVFDSRGRPLGSNRLYLGQDALLDIVLPADGDYFVRLCEFAYQRGGADYFYRLSVSTKPWIDAVYPPAVEAGKPSQVTLYGRNLPGGQPEPGSRSGGAPLEKVVVQIAPPTEADGSSRLRYLGWLAARSGSVDGFEYRVRGDAGLSNPQLITYADGPVILDAGQNDTPETAQPITVPCDLSGRIEARGDRDWYSFSAKKDDVFMFEGFADRLNSPIDLYFYVRRADGNNPRVGEYDENPDQPGRLGRFFTYTGDPQGRFVAPADGTYQLLVSSRSAQTRAGARFIYRVSVRKETPDFRLVAVSNPHGSSVGCTLRQGASQAMQVICYRRDGFDGEVRLSVEGLPAGVTCPPQVLGPGLKETYLVFTAAGDAADWTGPIKIKGTATIGDSEVSRDARPACLVWPAPNQQNVPALSRMADSLWLAVRPKGAFVIEAPDQEVAVPVGGATSVKLQVKRQLGDFKSPIVITRIGAPVLSNGNLINIPNLTIAPDKTEGEVKFTVPGNVAPGVYNLVFEGNAPYQMVKDEKSKKKTNLQIFELAPAIRLTVFNEVANIELGSPKVVLAPGGEQTLGLKVKRLRDFKGELAVELLLPRGVQGIGGDKLTIPASATEGTITLRADKNAKPVNLDDARLKVTAKLDKLTIAQEVKFNLAVSALAGGGSFKSVNLVAEGAGDWHYLAESAVKGDAWRNADFNDKGWKTGKAPLGYGEEELNKRKGTTIAETGQPVCFRRAFEIPADMLKAKGAAFRLSVASDNSAEVYINGKLVDRDPVDDHEFQYWNREVELDPKLFRPGANVVAVLVKNSDGSSDLFLDLALVALVPMEKGK